MLKVLVAGAIASLALFAEAQAQTCSFSLTSFSNGSTADAVAVNGNFTSITNCINTYVAPLASPHFTGSVGIGNYAGDAMLKAGNATDGVSLNQSGAVSYLYLGGNSAGNAVRDIRFDRSAGNLYIGTGTWGGSFTDQFVITSVGNLGIGTTSPSYLLYVNGSAGGTGAWQSPSDANLKKDIQALTGGLDMVEHLRPVQFRWRSPSERSAGKELKFDEGKPQIGFIAQEVEKVVPAAVVPPTKASGGLYGLKETDLIPVLVSAIKEQQAEIDQLKAQVAALKASH